jgi:hypothetical protein
MDGSADAEFHFPLGELFDDVPGVGERSREPLEFGDDHGVAGTDSGKGFPQSRSFPISARQLWST